MQNKIGGDETVPFTSIPTAVVKQAVANLKSYGIKKGDDIDPNLVVTAFKSQIDHSVKSAVVGVPFIKELFSEKTFRIPLRGFDRPAMASMSQIVAQL